MNAPVAKRRWPRLGPFSAPKKLIARGNQARDIRDWPEAARCYREALLLTPERADIWVQYGHALKESGEREQAEHAYRKALVIAPAVADTHLQLGHLLRLMGRPLEAVQAYAKSLQLDDNQYDALKELNHLAALGVELPRDVIVRAVTSEGEGLLPVIEPELLAGSNLDLARLSLAGLLETKPMSEDASAALKRALDELRALDQATAAKGGAGAAGPVMVFDVADLFGYFRNARLPTGIQRVQIEVISGLLRGADGASPVRICCFSEPLDDWVEVPAGLFLRICALALDDGDTTAPAWRGMLARIDLLMRSADAFAFPQGAFLINLGTSWWLQNYFLQVRRAKSERSIHYVPFVHDLIPIMTPEHCVRELTQDFITWVLGAFQHADRFLVNSNATRRDLIAVAARLGHTLDEDAVCVIRLDADYRKAHKPPRRAPKDFGLEPGRFVLFVSTIESRKNHVGALKAWTTLIRDHGLGATPKLVCVGNQGWLNDQVHAMLASNPVLNGRVVLLSKLSDAELAGLYDACLFTLYPSHYEGWGLPVTESLCHGKTPLISNASSLPEAGGEFAEYFEAGSDRSLVEALERMIFDAGHRQTKERVIAERFRARPWAEIGDQIEGAVAQWRDVLEVQSQGLEATPLAMPADLGVYYPIRRNSALRIWPGMVAGEMFRSGPGWWWPDDWGVYTRPGGGEVAIRVAGPHGRLRGFFRIRGLRDDVCDWSVEFSAPEGVRPQSGRLAPNEGRWLTVDLPANTGDTLIQVRLGAAQSQSLAPFTDGQDARVRSVGLEGFYLCPLDDLAMRQDFSEALVAHDLERLTPGYHEQWS